MPKRIELQEREPIEVKINGVWWQLPADIPLEQYQHIIRMFQILRTGDSSDDQFVEAFNALNDAVLGLFAVYHKKSEVNKLNLGLAQMFELINKAYLQPAAEEAEAEGPFEQTASE